MEEFATHVRGALNNGLTPDEIRAALTQVMIYCGAPIGVDCFRIAKPDHRRIPEEQEVSEGHGRA